MMGMFWFLVTLKVLRVAFPWIGGFLASLFLAQFIPLPPPIPLIAVIIMTPGFAGFVEEIVATPSAMRNGATPPRPHPVRPPPSPRRRRS